MNSFVQFLNLYPFVKLPMINSKYRYYKWWFVVIMEWTGEYNSEKECVRTETDRRLLEIGIAIAVISILLFFSPLVFSQLENSLFHEYDLILTSSDESWFYGRLSVTYNDGVEPMNFILGGPLTESFPNGTTRKLSQYRLSIPRRFQGATTLILSYNCTGLNSTIGPIAFGSDDIGAIYSDINENQMWWKLR